MLQFSCSNYTTISPIKKQREKKSLKKEYLLVIYTIFVWGTLPAVTKLTLINISNMQVLFISSLIATICLFLYLIISRKIRLFHKVTKKDLLYLSGLGFLGNFLYSAFYYASLRILSSTDACTINYLWPVIASICASFVLNERIHKEGFLAILISFVGVVIISTKGGGLHILDFKGIFLCITGAICYGVFNVLNKQKGMDQYLCTTIYFAVTALCSGILIFMTEKPSKISMETFMGIVWLGVFIDAFATLAWGLAMQKIYVRLLSNFVYITPMVAMLVSFVFLGEVVEFHSVFGMIFILGGCIFQMFRKRNKSRNEGTSCKDVWIRKQ